MSKRKKKSRGDEPGLQCRGITIEDQGVVKGEDKWSFVRGGVFVIVGGVTNSTMSRTPLPFWLKMGGGIIQNQGEKWACYQ